MTTKTAVVVVVVRGVLNIFKVLGGFPYSWGDAPPSPSPFDLAHSDVSITSGSSTNHGDNTSAGCWAGKRDYSPSCQQLCPKLRRGLAHKVWVVVISLTYLVIASSILYGFLKIDIPQYLISSAVLYKAIEFLTGAVLLYLLFHLVMRSDHLVTLVSHLDILPPGQSLHTWASIRTACVIPIPMTILATTICTMMLLPPRVKLESLTNRLIAIVIYLGQSLLAFIILMTYNVLLYLMCVVLAARMRDLRITLEVMREKRNGRGARQVAGPVVCGLWRAQKQLNTYFGPPIMVIVVVMILVTIANIYDIFSTRPVNAYSIVYGLTDLLNLIYLCCAPGMVHDQLEDLRFVMSKWRLETTDSQTEKELMHLLDLVDSYPNFSIGGYFKLSRATLVDILGFSATYLVVLLQFHVGETNSTTSQSPQTKDFPMM
ncbi:uncharacterized protein LOC123511526 [Portunus trituberculatus]|uniref:uncharacterized protein LOC123511526 n=1 Tax=Portunus trituberculatus TaxID=210409 RepID=UPI001E1CC7A0|nr:uncharacterized protein LOC123511526 [Portunus trituberculatus]